MDNVIWRLLNFWRTERQIAEECRAIDEQLGIEDAGGDAAKVISIFNAN